jgi:hypothetical protein
MPGSESNDEDMTAYVKAGDALRMVFDCAVVIVHHCGHEGTRPRGHSSLMGACDAQIAVKRDAADNIIATVELMKDGPQGGEFASRLEVVEFGTDDDGDIITSCVITPVEGLQPSAKASAGIKLTKAAKNALSALNNAIDECGEVPPASNHIPAGMKCVKADQWARIRLPHGRELVRRTRRAWPRSSRVQERGSRPADKCATARHYPRGIETRVMVAQNWDEAH